MAPMTKAPRKNSARPSSPINEMAAKLLDQITMNGDQVAAALEARLGRSYDKSVVSKMRSSRGVTDAEMAVLRSLADGSADDSRQTPAPIRFGATTDSVPLFGYANAAGDVMRLSEDHIVRQVPALPAQIGSRGAFAVYVFGDSMEPALRSGYTAFAVRNMPPVRGELCIIELKDGEALIKTFEGMDASTVFASQLNPAKKLSYPRREVANLYRVVGSQYV